MRARSRFGDLVPAFGLHEVFGQDVCGQILECGGRVNPAAREGGCFVVYVRRKDPNVGPIVAIPKGLGDDDGQRVSLFGPSSNRPTRCGDPGARAEPRRSARGGSSPQILEELRVAEELRDLDQEAVDEPGVLLRIGPQIGRISGQCWVPGGTHAAVQPALDRGRLVAAEVDAAPLVDPFE